MKDSLDLSTQILQDDEDAFFLNYTTLKVVIPHLFDYEERESLNVTVEISHLDAITQGEVIVYILDKNDSTVDEIFVNTSDGKLDTRGKKEDL